MTSISDDWNKVIKKRLIIYGTGNTGKEFYNKFRDILPIYACTSSEKETIPIENLKVVPYQELNQEKDFLIICSLANREIRYRLMLEGWKINNNFMNSSIFQIIYDCVFSKKKLIVAIGQCEIREMFLALSRIESFSQKYAVVYFDEREVCNHGNRRQWEEIIECLNILDKADYFVRPSALNPATVMSFNFFKQKLNRECRTIVVSLFHFDSYWPQDISKERQVSKYYVTQPGVKICAFVESDRIIDRLLEEGHSCREIIKLVKREDFFTQNEVVKNHQNTLKRVKITDRLSDIKVTDYVEENYNKVKLYCDRGHFDQALLRIYVKKFLIYLGEAEAIDELQKIVLDDIFERINEFPIYPSTSKILNLEWIEENTLYRMVLPSGIKKVTFDEYMELLVEYRYQTQKILKLC
ncbi:MAG: WcbI family polysaccharide biosynthesis putative acetyltransferase [Lachnospiraceae bacterium]|nr:WcbI family polysaccharide biosynthesis putative acetyltransferase [Lachnospiraceae bacterium]